MPMPALLPTATEIAEALGAGRQAIAEYLQTIDRLDALDGFSREQVDGLLLAGYHGIGKALDKSMAENFDHA